MQNLFVYCLLEKQVDAFFVVEKVPLAKSNDKFEVIVGVRQTKARYLVLFQIETLALSFWLEAVDVDGSIV